ncbi:uncharacterized protein SOCE26_039600 [Sorangium cellulosum]|uniref:Uncharacterized protein n=1 Tax=Sorangium cellulosum TaxID=56 RepID=A0A2L0ETA2_SORCE|nr:uncharacterized protein SOCE26_039600 [Sorangium cellulosum]
MESMRSEPPYPFTMMSWLSESPSPVPSPASFVVKKGLHTTSSRSLGMPTPLSRTRISTASCAAAVARRITGVNPPPERRSFFLRTA